MLVRKLLITLTTTTNFRKRVEETFLKNTNTKTILGKIIVKQ